MASLASLRHFSYVSPSLKQHNVFSSRENFHNGSFWENDSREKFWNEGSHPDFAWLTLPHLSNLRNIAWICSYFIEIYCYPCHWGCGENDLGMVRAPKRRHRSAYHQLDRRMLWNKGLRDQKRQLATRYRMSASSINRSFLSENLDVKVRKKRRVHSLTEKQMAQRLERGPRFVKLLGTHKSRLIFTMD